MNRTTIYVSDIDMYLEKTKRLNDVELKSASQKLKDKRRTPRANREKAKASAVKIRVARCGSREEHDACRGLGRAYDLSNRTSACQSLASVVQMVGGDRLYGCESCGA